jgi:putative membrane protein
MMKRLLTIITLFIVGLLFTWGFSIFHPNNSFVVAQTKPMNQTSQMNEIDQMFMKEASQGGLGNIMLGELALKKSNNSQVKAFANAEIQEQQQVKSNLMRIAPQAGMTLPTTPAPKFQAAMNRLSQLDGERFDQAYMAEGGVNAHLENAALFQREAAFGQNPDLVSLTNGGLPIIRQHFNTASAATNYQFAQVPQTFNNQANAPTPIRQMNVKPVPQ